MMLLWVGIHKNTQLIIGILSSLTVWFLNLVPKFPLILLHEICREWLHHLISFSARQFNIMVENKWLYFGSQVDFRILCGYPLKSKPVSTRDALLGLEVPNVVKTIILYFVFVRRKSNIQYFFTTIFSQPSRKVLMQSVNETEYFVFSDKYKIIISISWDSHVKLNKVPLQFCNYNKFNSVIYNIWNKIKQSPRGILEKQFLKSWNIYRKTLVPEPLF